MTDLEKIVAGDTNTSIKTDLDIKGVQENSRDINCSAYQITVFTEQAKELCNECVGFPIFTELPCSRLVGKSTEKEIREKAHDKKFTFMYGGFVSSEEV